MHISPYKRLTVMILLSFVAMYLLMYAMVNAFSNALPNINQFYMAGLMTMPMALIELLIMKSMYVDTKLNGIIIALTIVLGIGFFISIRQQSQVNDKQFLRSMIPHHAGAILMCEKASISDPEIKTLCRNIVASQQAEIAQMRLLLGRVKN